MKLLEDTIRREGTIRPGGILKIDNFLNHQIDTKLLYEMALEFKRLYSDEEINKILTIEASGIAIAAVAGFVFGCPILFAKKSKSRNISDDVWSTEVASFTHGNTNTVLVSREFLGPKDRVLIIDDFLANGQAVLGLQKIINDAGATLCGCGIAIEKGFQPGGELLKEKGIVLKSLAVIESMDAGKIVFREENC